VQLSPGRYGLAAYAGSSVALSADGGTAVVIAGEGTGINPVQFTDFYSFDGAQWSAPQEFDSAGTWPVVLSGDGLTALVGTSCCGERVNHASYYAGTQLFRSAGGKWSLVAGMLDNAGAALSSDGSVAVLTRSGKDLGMADIYAPNPTGVVVTVKASGPYGRFVPLKALPPKDERIHYNPAGEAANVTGSLTCKTTNAKYSHPGNPVGIVACSGLTDPGHTIVYDYVNSLYTITRAHSRLAYTGPKSISHGSSVLLSAVLTSRVTGKPISWQRLTIQIGAGGTAQTCTTKPTGSHGGGSCVIAGVQTDASPSMVKIMSPGDSNYLPSQTQAKVQITGQVATARGAQL